MGRFLVIEEDEEPVHLLCTEYKKMEKLVGIGEILWDVFPDGAVLGGAVLNFAMDVNSMGMEGIVISSLGRDSLGTQAKKVCDDRGLKYNEVKNKLIEEPYFILK